MGNLRGWSNRGIQERVALRGHEFDLVVVAVGYCVAGHVDDCSVVGKDGSRGLACVEGRVLHVVDPRFVYRDWRSSSVVNYDSNPVGAKDHVCDLYLLCVCECECQCSHPCCYGNADCNSNSDEYD